MCSQLDRSFGSPPLQAVLQSDSEFWSTSTSDVAYSKIKQLVQAFLLQERSKEEMKMLKTNNVFASAVLDKAHVASKFILLFG